jgi:DNA-binding IscR family transcriptional regulator
MQGILRHTDYAARVVARLAAAGILRTARGAGGGVRLAPPAREISLLDVIRAMEGGVTFADFSDSPQRSTRRRKEP